MTSIRSRPPTWPTGSGVLLDLIRSAPAWNRRELIDELGWSRSTLAKRLEELRDADLIVTEGQQDSTGGRPAEAIALNAGAGVVLSLDVGASHSRLAISDLAGKILAEDEAAVLIGAGPAEVFDWAQQCFDLLLARLRRQRHDVRAIGMGIPDAVDPVTGVLNNPIMMPSWNGTVLADALRPAFPDAVFAVERDVSIMALAEQRHHWRDSRDFALVKVSSWLGCGFILDGGIHRGAHGGAGDLGHLMRRTADGRVGHLNELAGGWALQRDLMMRGHRVRTTSDIVALVKRGDADATRWLTEASAMIGEALVDIVTLMNPSVLVIGGTLATAGEPVLGPIRGLLEAQAPLLPAGVPQIAVSRLGPRAGIVGAAMIARDALFDPDRISALTGSRDDGHDHRPVRYPTATFG